jgi:hypothetical protein
LWFGTNEESVVEVVEVILALERRVAPAMIWIAAAGVPIPKLPALCLKASMAGTGQLY